MNNMEMNYNTRNMMNSVRGDEGNYEMSGTMDMNNSINPGYIMNGTTLTGNNYPSEYMTEREKFTTDMLTQMKLEQDLNSYNNVSMNNGTMMDPNESLNMYAMKPNMDTNVYDTYRNMLNYNNTHNTMTGNIPVNMEEIPNEAMYMNPNANDMFTEEYMKNLPVTIDPSTISFPNDFKIPNANFNPLIPDNYNMSNCMPIFENMNNPQMFMQHSLTNKQTKHIPMQNMTPFMKPNLVPCTSLRKIPALNKKKIKPKKFFPCC